jgi:hypothetical protein
LRLFIIRILQFVGLYLIFNALIAGLLPYDYGNMQFKKKKQIFRTLPQTNTLFFGSSQTACHIIPQVVDSITGNSHSYNLGTFAGNHPECYILLESFLKSKDSENIRTIVLEVQPLSDLVPKNGNHTRSNYWSRVSEIRYARDYLKSSAYPPSNIRTIPVKYALFGFLKWIDPYKLKYGFGLNREKDYGDYRALRGFDPLTDTTTKDYQNFRKDTTQSLKPKAEALKEMLSNKKGLNTEHLKRLERLSGLAKSKGIQLFYYFSPKRVGYHYAAEVLPALPQDRVLNMISPDDYPEFYRASYAYDLAHLNPVGAHLLSVALGKSLLSKQLSVR